MLIIFDIGNTNITIGLFWGSGGKAALSKTANDKPIKVWRLSTLNGGTADEYGIFITNIFNQASIDIQDIKAVAIASVVPSLNLVFETLSKQLIGKKPFFINQKNSGGLKIKLQNPKELGADRIANAAAAFSLFGGGCIVIDFGTATTFDCIDLKGRYIGGAIALGPNLAAQALNLRAAQLPLVEMKNPQKAIGTSTVECIQSGLYYGYIGLIKEILARTKKEMKIRHIIATGGLAQIMSEAIEEIESVEPDLTLQGIKIIWENSNRKSN
ncbi:MAG: type III pantothenate kinase [Elusimicrobiota bacterium]|jgi:type III pantothenate kinase|nr:type III pantothenate kinase [Elusimicrobiota bacterium]